MTLTLSLQPINIRLCGSVPRNDHNSHDDNVPSTLLRGAPCWLASPAASYFASVNGPTHGGDECKDDDHKVKSTDTMRSIVISATQEEQGRCVVVDNNTAAAPLMDPPAWAVPAQGETRLEPVCEATGRQSPVDLTQRACFRIGRSPNADVQLHHATSSRRHAMVVHHENGSCYVVDCGSAHGTFINGQRLTSPCGGKSVPHKLRRGAMVRFGGPGAPCFILKSFSFHLSDIQEDDSLEVVRLNTRLNALGESASQAVRSQLSVTIQAALIVTRKRSFDSLDSRETIDEIPCHDCKRLRCSSPELSPELAPLRLVSPDLPMKSHHRVTFAPESPRLFYPSPVLVEEEQQQTAVDDDEQVAAVELAAI